MNLFFYPLHLVHVDVQTLVLTLLILMNGFYKPFDFSSIHANNAKEGNFCDFIDFDKLLNYDSGETMDSADEEDSSNQVQPSLNSSSMHLNLLILCREHCRFRVDRRCRHLFTKRPKCRVVRITRSLRVKLITRERWTTTIWLLKVSSRFENLALIYK